MNGMNSYKSWRKSFYALSIIYIVVVIGFVYIINNIPQYYSRVDKERVSSIQIELNNILEDPDKSNMVKSLQTFTEDNKICVAVEENDKEVYSNIDYHEIGVSNSNIDDSLLTYQGLYAHETPTNTYDVWLIIYTMSPQSFFESVMHSVLIAIIILCLIISSLVLLLFKKLINPLERFQQNILNLKEYRLSEIGSLEHQTEYDHLSKELSEFSYDLEEKIGSLDVKYTKLELELQKREEQSIYQMDLVRALVHTLKTPINISMLYLEQLQNDNANPIYSKLVDNNERLLKLVNESLQVITKDDKYLEEKRQRIDIIPMVKETISLFTTSFSKRNISVALDIPSSLWLNVKSIEFKQILHNIVSNASMYADSDSNYELVVKEENDSFIIESYNDREDISQIDFNRVFDLFYHVDSTTHTIGSGVGMYTIKNMVNEYHGSSKFTPYKNGVLLVITIPLNNGDDEQ